MTGWVHQTIQLPESDWRALERIAAELNCFYRGKPSWRVLLRRLARGEIKIVLPCGIDLLTQDEIRPASPRELIRFGK